MGAGCGGMMPRRDKHDRSVVKILLLGPAGSGKSTVCKQMKILFGSGNFSHQEEQDYRIYICVNVVEGMCSLVSARERLEMESLGNVYKWQNAEESSASATALRLFSTRRSHLRDLTHAEFRDLVPHILTLWRDEAIRNTFRQRGRFTRSVPDTLSYFFEHLMRLAQPDFTPTNRDILYCRKRTTDISEYETQIGGVSMRFIDVGGQRTQRQKWFHVFHGSVVAILFLVSMSDYDSLCPDDATKNAFEEACDVYDSIVNNPFCPPMILFMNKKDLLENKIAHSDTPFNEYFPDFNRDPHDVLAVQDFLLGKVISRWNQLGEPQNGNPGRLRRPDAAKYHHFTIALVPIPDPVKCPVIVSNVMQSVKSHVKCHAKWQTCLPFCMAFYMTFDTLHDIWHFTGHFTGSGTAPWTRTT